MVVVAALVSLASSSTACTPSSSETAAAPAAERIEADAVVAEPVAEPVAEQTPRRTVSIAMGGDLLIHNAVWQSAQAEARAAGIRPEFDFRPMFSDVRQTFESADVALCHAEVPFARPGQPLQSYPLFAAPPQLGRALAGVGFDACTTASNHSLDQGFAGLAFTRRVLQREGIEPVGTFTRVEQRREPVILATADGVRVAVVAGTYGLNGLPLPPGKEWSISLANTAVGAEQILRQARRAKRRGADLVIAHLHAGSEYVTQPNAEQIALVEELTASGIVDLVLGEHAHVVQPITKVNGVWVAYGMGNLVAAQDAADPRRYEGIITKFRFAERADGDFTVARAAYQVVAWRSFGFGPIRVERVPRRIDPADPEAARLQAIRSRTETAVDLLGDNSGLVAR